MRFVWSHPTKRSLSVFFFAPLCMWLYYSICHSICHSSSPELAAFFKKDFIYLLLEKGEGRERNTNVWEIKWLVVSHTPLAGDLVHNRGMCPDWEWNQWPFGSKPSTQITGPHQPGLNWLLFEDKEWMWSVLVFPRTYFIVQWVVSVQSPLLNEKGHTWSWNKPVFQSFCDKDWNNYEIPNYQ